MKILLLGDYSGLHVNLADGLRKLGHDVMLASDGNGYKNFFRDIDIGWSGKWRYLKMIMKLLSVFPRFIGYDVVQLIGMPFLDLRPLNNKIIYHYLKLFNKKIFLGSNTTEFEYVNYALTVGYKASFINHKKILNKDPWAIEYVSSIVHSTYSKFHKKMTDSVNGITACCVEYKMGCDLHYADKTAFIPLPYQVVEEKYINTIKASEKIRFFLGKQSYRSVIKGMDVIEEALIELEQKYPDDVEVTVVDSIPYDEYRELMESSHIVCDQLYCYGAGLNAVIAMAKGLIVAGGGEEEMYELFGEKENKPIVNLPDTKKGVIEALEDLLKRRNDLPQLARQSREFAIKYHDHIKVAQEYVDFWRSRS